MTDDELDRLQDDYIAAVKLAKRAGVDFVGVKQCHRYLLSEMLAAKKRAGKYGGSLENRTRFAREVMGRINGEFDAKGVQDDLDASEALKNQGIEFIAVGPEGVEKWRNMALDVERRLAEEGVYSRELFEKMLECLKGCPNGKGGEQ